jgi:hypothetical protein
VVAARSQYGASSYDIDTYQQLQGEFYWQLATDKWLLLTTANW